MAIFNQIELTTLVDNQTHNSISCKDLIAKVATGVSTTATYAEIPSDASGWYFVTTDETKSGNPTLYLFVNGVRYWLAMTEDA